MLMLSLCLVFPGFPGFSSMFGKKKKRLEISAPSNFEHRVHTGFDPREQKFTGLPQQWQSLLADTANRPKPMVDPSYITPIQLAPMKVEFVFLSSSLLLPLPSLSASFPHFNSPLHPPLVTQFVFFPVPSRTFFCTIWALRSFEMFLGCVAIIAQLSFQNRDFF